MSASIATISGLVNNVNNLAYTYVLALSDFLLTRMVCTGPEHNGPSCGVARISVRCRAWTGSDRNAD